MTCYRSIDHDADIGIFKGILSFAGNWKFSELC